MNVGADRWSPAGLRMVPQEDRTVGGRWDPRPVGNVDRGLRQLAELWAHPDFQRHVSDGVRRERAPLHDELRRAVLARDGYTCGACGYTLVRDWRADLMMQVDHLIPVAAGGDDRSTNLRTLCARCNEEKSNRFTADVRSVRPRLIVAYCHDDLDLDVDGELSGGFDAYEQRDRRVFCAYCRGLRSVDASHTARFDISVYLELEPAFTDMYTQRRLSLGRCPQMTLGMPVERQDRWRQIYRDVHEAGQPS